ncbi:STYKc, partial [Musa troglodytarum]
MGWRCELSRPWIIFVVVFASVICRLEGLGMAPSPASFDYPSQKGMASSPAHLTNSGRAIAPRSDSFPKVFSPTYGAVPPSFQPVIPSMLSPAPSTHVATGHKWSRAVSPSIEGQPIAPISSAVFGSPGYSQPSSSNKPPIIPTIAPKNALAPHSTYFHGSVAPPTSISSPISSRQRHGVPVASPPAEGYRHLTPANGSPSEGSSPMLSPVHHKAKPSNLAHGPSTSHLQPPAMSTSDGPAVSPLNPVQQWRPRKGVGNLASSPTSPVWSPSHLPAPMVTPTPEAFPKYHRPHHASPPSHEDPMVAEAPEAFPKNSQPHHAYPPSHQGPSFSSIQAPSPSPSSSVSSDSNAWLGHSPITTPSSSHPRSSSAAPPPPIWVLPPPPPNLDCKSLVCVEPLTIPPPGSPCVCVLPIRVGLRLSTTLYTFFPLVPEFAQEIAFGLNMKQSQVRIMGANVASDQPENTIVLIDLVPVEEKFDTATAFLSFEKFWHKDIVINTSLFGDYAVLYVLYPGLPPSPPRAPGGGNIGSFGNNSNAMAIKPLGVDVRKQKGKTNWNLIAVIILSSFSVLILCVGAAWFLWLKQRDHSHLPATNLHKMLPLFAKSSGTRHMILGQRLSSESASFNSSIATYTGSAKTFSVSEIETATNRFDEARIIGEGGFGRVYQGTLEDGTRVAVKILKRDDHQGGREFYAEVEMLSRLHHRNLVKLIGICTEEHIRCLVYELIPNGSLESHLHGLDKETSPLDWSARLKIALGAARALAYLHEDSSPRVIHRDFKSSNILLDHDYIPKVSDFGLARAALDEQNLHISTRMITDPALGMNVPFESVAKVAAIASMCVQPEVSHRPFMGEVVQALKLVCNECDENKGTGSFSHDDLSTQDTATRLSNGSGLEAERVLLGSCLSSTSTRLDIDESGSFQRHSSSGPLITTSRQFWRRLRMLSTGSISEHGAALKYETSSDCGER